MANTTMRLPFDNYIISAASGTGKTTLNRQLMAHIPELRLSVSHTTRTKRPGEIEGDHYHFVDKKTFSRLITEQQMLEWAEIFGNYYGTSLSELQRINQAGNAALLEIDVQGWAQAKPKLSSSCSIFLLPPSIEELWRRLSSRGTDNPAAIRTRFLTARQELDQALLYEHFVINDTLEVAFTEMRNFIVKQSPLSLTAAQGLAFCQELAADFDRFQVKV